MSDPEYRQEIKSLSVETYGIAPKAQKLATQMELATLFLVHAAEREWNMLRGAKTGKQDLYQWLNYQNKLLKQDPEAEFVVLYNAAGTNLSAGLYRRAQFKSAFYAEHKLYCAVTQTRPEGEYLTAILNSAGVNAAIKPFQSMGLLGERDIEKKVLELPIPQFDKTDKVHLRHAELGESASKAVASAVQSRTTAGTLGTRRRLARESAAAQLEEIDKLVKGLLSPHHD